MRKYTKREKVLQSYAKNKLIFESTIAQAKAHF